MPESARRKRFQIHLSTALIMMLAAGVLIWANTRPVSVMAEMDWDSMNPSERDEKYAQYLIKLKDLVHRKAIFTPREYNTVRFGAPSIVIERFQLEFAIKDGTTETIAVYSPVRRLAIAINVIVALLILFVIWFVCEWWIRRREASAKMRDGK